MKQMTINRVRTEPFAGIKSGSELLVLAQGWLKQGNPIVAIELLKTAIESIDTERDKQLRAQILKETGRAKMMQSDWTNSETYYLEAQRLFIELEDYKGAAQCARNRANMNFQQGNYHESEKLCETALDYATVENDHELRATILNTMGAIKSATGNLQESIKMLKLCLSDFESSGNIIRQGYIQLNIGLTQIELADYHDATQSLNHALSIALEVRDQSLLEICYQNISKCYLAQQEYILAKSVLDTARKILPGLNSKALEVELNLIECKILRVTGNLEKAADLLRVTYQQAIENEQTALEADLLFEQALVGKELGNIDFAVSKLNAAINIYKKIGVEKSFKEAVQILNNFRKKNNV